MPLDILSSQGERIREAQGGGMPPPGSDIAYFPAIVKNNFEATIFAGRERRRQRLPSLAKEGWRVCAGVVLGMS